MIDTHVHILTGVDDEPETIQESFELAEVLVRESVHSAIATPHYNDQFPQRSAEKIQERVNDLQQALDRHNIQLRLFISPQMHMVLINDHHVLQQVYNMHSACLVKIEYIR